MEENREVKSAREIAIVIGIIVICLMVGFAVYKFIIIPKEDTEDNTKTEENSNDSTGVDYTKYNDNQELNAFYTDFTYTDIRNLGTNYNVDTAINDGVFVHTGTEMFNEEALLSFEGNVENGVASSLRIIETTVEGDMIITDLKYDGTNVKVVRDFTRDRYMNVADATITYLEYEGVNEYEYNGQRVLVIHNGELTDETFEKDTTSIMIFLG